MCVWAREPAPMSSLSARPDEPFNTAWLNNAIQVSRNTDDVLFIAFGGAF